MKKFLASVLFFIITLINNNKAQALEPWTVGPVDIETGGWSNIIWKKEPPTGKNPYLDSLRLRTEITWMEHGKICEIFNDVQVAETDALRELNISCSKDTAFLTIGKLFTASGFTDNSGVMETVFPPAGDDVFDSYITGFQIGKDFENFQIKGDIGIKTDHHLSKTAEYDEKWESSAKMIWYNAFGLSGQFKNRSNSFAIDVVFDPNKQTTWKAALYTKRGDEKDNTDGGYAFVKYLPSGENSDLEVHGQIEIFDKKNDVNNFNITTTHGVGYKINNYLEATADLQMNNHSKSNVVFRLRTLF